VSDIGSILTVLLTVYGLAVAVFLISENRPPQATLAWMLAFIFAPGLGVVIYFLFGRDHKAFSKQRKLLKQDLETHARRLLPPSFRGRIRRSPDWKATVLAARG
jgi:cardiolipin synthase A/B